MMLTIEQNPLKVNETTHDRLLIAIDRGNSGSKAAVSVNGIPLEPFKIPSVIRRVEADGVIKIGNQSYVCGDAAIGMTTGNVSTPLQNGDKVKDLAIVVAQVVQKISETHPLSSDLKLSLVVSSPFASDALAKQIKTELKALDHGFTVNGRFYSIELTQVQTEFEGAVLLKAAHEFNGVIDIGFGTILAGYRAENSSVAIVPLMGGDLGGCNLAIKALLNDPAFLAAVKKPGASAPPSAERLSAKLSEGVTVLRGIDLTPLLKTHLKVLKQRIEDAAIAVSTELRLSSETGATPKIALIGGGAALLKLVLSEAQLQAWGEKLQGVTTGLQGRLNQGNGVKTSLVKAAFLRFECHELMCQR